MPEAFLDQKVFNAWINLKCVIEVHFRFAMP
jgi:hypothetical protein